MKAKQVRFPIGPTLSTFTCRIGERTFDDLSHPESKATFTSAAAARKEATMKIDEQGWLVSASGEPAGKQLPTGRSYPLATPAPLGIVWHTTDERGGPGYAEALARRIQNFRRGVDRPASWHLLIAKDGAIYQSAPFTVGTWHVGVPGVIAGRRFANINHATIGCELENAGRLRRLGDQAYCWPFYVHPEAPGYERRPDPKCALELGRAVATPEGLFDTFT